MNSNEIEFNLKLSTPQTNNPKCFIPLKTSNDTKIDIECQIIGTDGCPIYDEKLDLFVGSNPSDIVINNKRINFQQFSQKSTVVSITEIFLHKLKFDEENKKYYLVFNDSIIDCLLTNDILMNINLEINKISKKSNCTLIKYQKDISYIIHINTLFQIIFEVSKYFH